MTIAYYCLLVAIFIPLICAGYSKFSVKGYDNRNPREFLNNLSGRAKRAHYAQLNAYEVFPLFAVGLIIAHQLHAPQATVDLLAITFVIARILYSAFYIIDQHVLRTTAWFIGFGVTLTLFFVGK